MGESELNPGFPFPDCGPDFEKAKADGIELGVGEIGPGEERTPEGMEKRIGEAVQKQSEGVGIERMAGGFENGADFPAGGPFARTENGGDEFSACAFEDHQGLKAEGVVIAVEKGKLLCAVGGVFGVIQVQNKMLGRNLVRGDETVHQGVSQTAKIFGGKRILKPGDRGLTGKVLFGRKPATGHFESGVNPKSIGVEGVFIAARDLEDALGKQVA